MTMIKHVRRGSLDKPLISIRRNSIAFNANFITTARIEQKSRVTVTIEPELFKVGFKFHGDLQDEDSYALTRDGGRSRNSRGRAAQLTSLIHKNLWLKAISSEPDQTLRRFEPRWNSIDSCWVIFICPSFENRVNADDISNIPREVHGIYRYKRQDEIVYIGRGDVRSRTENFDRKRWDFDKIEYPIVSDKTEQKKWEKFWIDAFEEQHGKLPLYNLIRGEQSKDGERSI